MGGGYGFANAFTSRGLSLSFLRDNIPDGSHQNNYFRTMYDVDRIEVLKGPGSALFGVAGPGGSINMITRKPQNDFSLSAGTMLGSFGTRNGYVDVTGAIPYVPNVAGRLIADMEHTDGFRGLERNIVEASHSFIWRIAPDKTLLVDYDRREVPTTAAHWRPACSTSPRPPIRPRQSPPPRPCPTPARTGNRRGLASEAAISAPLRMRRTVVDGARTLGVLRNAGRDQCNAE